MRDLKKVGEPSKSRIAGASIVERAVAQKGELGAVISKLIDLAVIKLKRANKLRRFEQLERRSPEKDRRASGGSVRSGVAVLYQYRPTI